MRWWPIEALRALGISSKLGMQVGRGVYHLSKLSSPIITIFGGAGLKIESKDGKQVYDFSYRCAQEGMSILTGGGPGVMQAGNCGARDGRVASGLQSRGTHTLGISVRGLDEGFANPCAPVIYVDDFFVRKRLLILYSRVFIFFPGGIGTMDELFDVLNLAKHGLTSAVPVILFNSEYWKSLTDWYQAACDDHGLIKPEDKQLIRVVDTVDQALEVVKDVVRV